MSAVLKNARAAGLILAQIEDGTLKPGSLAPSGAALARLTGYSPITCRKAIRSLIGSGVLVPGAGPGARARVAVPGTDGPVDRAARELSAALAARRIAAGLTQRTLAALAGCSVTTVRHAETGRTWQGRGFWERADAVLGAGGELLRLYDGTRGDGDPVCVLAVWGDGSAAVVPPHLAALIIPGLRAGPGTGLAVTARPG